MWSLKRSQQGPGVSDVHLNMEVVVRWEGENNERNNLNISHRICVSDHLCWLRSFLSHPWKRSLIVSYERYQMLNILSTRRQVQTAWVRPSILDCSLHGGVVLLLVWSKIGLPRSESLFSDSVSRQTVMTEVVLDIYVEITNLYVWYVNMR